MVNKFLVCGVVKICLGWDNQKLLGDGVAILLRGERYKMFGLG